VNRYKPFSKKKKSELIEMILSSQRRRVEDKMKGHVVNAPSSRVRGSSVGFSFVQDRATMQSSTMIRVQKSIPQCAGMSNDDFYAVYTKCVSDFQSNQSKAGKNFEDAVSSHLSNHGIVHSRQVCVNLHGYIIPQPDKTQKNRKGTKNEVQKRESCKKVDIVVGNATEGTHISEYSVLSCKKSCRERYTQDDWFISPNTRPKKYFLITDSKDFPPSNAFKETVDRKIISSKTKQTDDRRYKLRNENLLEELENE